MTTAPEAPATTLRRAAEKLREFATAVTPGPWEAVPVVYGPPDDGWGAPSNWEIHGPFAETVVSHQVHEGGGIDTQANADYIAAMHPGVGLALADWLVVCAQHMGRFPGDDQLNTKFKQGGYAVARAVLGEAS